MCKSIAIPLLYFSVFVLLSAIVVKYYMEESWSFQRPLYPHDFNDTPEMIKRELKITYYIPGQLNEVLPKWHHESPGSYFHLYRVHPSSSVKFHFNLSSVPKMRDYGVFTYQLLSYKKDSTRLHSSLCKSSELYAGLFTIADVLNRRCGGDCFASFRMLNESDLYEYGATETNPPSTIFDKLFPALREESPFIPFAEKTYRLIHAFVSNFDYPRVSTSIHSNCGSESVAIQLIGAKSWIFYPPEVYLGKDYLHSKLDRYSSYPTHSPRKPYEYYLYTSQPGDILFFSESWGHTVYSHAGPNLMVNFRKRPNWLTLLRKGPFAFFHITLSSLWTPNNHRSPVLDDRPRVLTWPACDGQLSRWDQQQLALLMGHALSNGDGDDQHLSAVDFLGNGGVGNSKGMGDGGQNHFHSPSDTQQHTQSSNRKRSRRKLNKNQMA